MQHLIVRAENNTAIKGWQSPIMKIWIERFKDFLQFLNIFVSLDGRLFEQKIDIYCSANWKISKKGFERLSIQATILGFNGSLQK